MPFDCAVILLLVSSLFGSNALRIPSGTVTVEHESLSISNPQMESFSCDVKLGSTPTFQQWRRCGQRPGWGDSMDLETNFGTPTYEENPFANPFTFEYPTERISQCSQQYDVIRKPNQDQFTTDTTSKDLTAILTRIVSYVDAVYVLCIDCNSVKVPKDANNVFLVDGLADDRCFKEMEEGPDSLEHWKKVTFSHKTAVAHATQNKFENLTLIEEDVLVNQHWGGAHQLADLHELMGKVKVQWAENDQQVVRFTHLPWQLASVNGTCVQDKCKCHRLDDTLCKLPKSCTAVHDSSWYMLSKSAYPTFMNFVGIVDMQGLASLDSVLVTPPITWQQNFECHKYTTTIFCNTPDQIEEYGTYEKACIYS